MAVDFNTYVNRQQIAGDTLVSDFAKKAVRNPDINNLQVGDVLVFPKEFGEKCPILHSKRMDVDYVVVPTADGSYRSIFPGMFMKNLEICEIKDGEVVGTGERLRATGTAVDLFQEKDSIGDAMKQFLDKKIKISARDQKTVRDFDNPDRLVNSTAYKFDIVK